MHIIFTYNVLSGSNGYKSGFNGKENVEEIDGWQDYGERMYNRLIGRFPTADPIIVYQKQYPELSTYQFASNSPIMAIDLDGLEKAIVIRWYDAINSNFVGTTVIYVANARDRNAFGANNANSFLFINANTNSTNAKQAFEQSNFSVLQNVSKRRPSANAAQFILNTNNGIVDANGNTINGVSF